MKKPALSNLNLSLLSLLQFFGAILVIAIHSQKVFDHHALHFIQKSIFGRMVVPFFMVSASFFIRRNQHQTSTYFKSQIRQYLFWSALYLPYFVLYLRSIQLPLTFYPFAFVIGLTYTGIGYQLWYIPAFLTGLFLVNVSLKKLGFFWTSCLALLLYLLGCSETYSAFLMKTSVGTVFTSYMDIFFTTRNGLFYTPVFILIGYALCDHYYSPFFQKRIGLKLLGSFILLSLEGWLIFHHQGIDKNFFLGLIPFTAFLVAFSLSSNLFKTRNLGTLKYYANYYYFLHLIPVEICLFLLKESSLDPALKGQLTFLISLLTCHLLAYFLIKHQKKT